MSAAVASRRMAVAGRPMVVMPFSLRTPDGGGSRLAGALSAGQRRYQSTFGYFDFGPLRPCADRLLPAACAASLTYGGQPNAWAGRSLRALQLGRTLAAAAPASRLCRLIGCVWHVGGALTPCLVHWLRPACLFIGAAQLLHLLFLTVAPSRHSSTWPQSSLLLLDRCCFCRLSLNFVCILHCICIMISIS